MISAQQYKDAVARASAMLEQAGIVITPEERARFEVADFGLGELEKTGLEIITHAKAPNPRWRGMDHVPAPDLPGALAPYD